MLKFIEGDKLVKEFCALRRTSAHADIAVAFWGGGAAAELKIAEDGSTRIICNLESGACDPDEIQRMMNSGLRIKTHRQLHAKTYLTENGAIVGSTNASTNGLAMSGSISAWREANILTDDKTLLRDIGAWFCTMWAQAREISDDDIKNARAIWAKRRRLAPMRDQEASLFKAAAAERALFEHVYCLVVFEDELSENANAILGQIGENSPRWDANFNFFWETNTRLQPDVVFIHCDFCDRQHPRVCGYARLPDPIIEIRVGRHYLYPAISENALNVGPTGLNITEDDQAQILNKLTKHHRVQNAHGWDVAVPLSELVKS